MNFFERQSRARRKTRILLCYFVPAAVLTIVAVYFIVVLALALCGLKSYWSVFTGGPLIRPALFSYVAGITLMAILSASFSKMQELSEGGPAMAMILGGRPVNPQTSDPDERRLLDVVEEMSIASGVPVPQVFVLPRERGINSFAAGFARGDTVIGVTQGAVKLLSRDELQGIIAHEFSHILNDDAHLNLWMIGLLYGILCISQLGQILLFRGGDDDDHWISRSSSGRGTAVLMVVGVLLICVGSLGYFFGTLIKCAVCRRREELADASAVQFTRNPLAIAGALKKIGGLEYGSRIQAGSCDEASHIFFGDISYESWFPPLRAHPRLRERILLLDPQFDGHYPKVLSWDAGKRGEQQLSQERVTPMPAIKVVAAAVGAGLVTAPSPRRLAYAAGLKASFDPLMTAAAHEPFGACGLVFAVLLSSDEDARRQQLIDVGPCAHAGLLRQAQEYLPLTDPMSNGQKLALFNLSLNGLRQMSGEQFETFCSAIQMLIESDRKVSLFEYTLQKTLRRNLSSYFQKKRPIVQYYSLQGLRSECAVLLSALAWNGSDDPQEVDRAFQAGLVVIVSSTGAIDLAKWDDCNLPQIDAAVEKLSQCNAAIKKKVLESCAAAVACDGMVQESEAELLRAIAEALDSPLPPLVSELGDPELVAINDGN